MDHVVVVGFEEMHRDEKYVLGAHSQRTQHTLWDMMVNGDLVAGNVRRSLIAHQRCGSNGGNGVYRIVVRRVGWAFWTISRDYGRRRRRARACCRRRTRCRQRIGVDSKLTPQFKLHHQHHQNRLVSARSLHFAERRTHSCYTLYNSGWGSMNLVKACAIFPGRHSTAQHSTADTHNKRVRIWQRMDHDMNIYTTTSTLHWNA